MKAIGEKITLLILPLVFFCFGINFNHTNYSLDPDYAYLMNGLLINNCDHVGHVDNPGTTVQSYSAVVQRIIHIFESADDLQTYVLKNPATVIEFGRIGFILLNSIFLLLLGIIVFKYTKNVWFSLITQVTPFLSSNLMDHVWTKFSPEPMLLFASNVLILALIYYHFSKNRENKLFPCIFGIIAGFGMATKVTFLPLLIVPLILLGQKKMKINYLIATIPSFIFFTIPAIPAYPQMYEWFLRLFTHTGTYGSGNAGIIDPLKFLHDLAMIFKNNIALSVCVFISVALLLFLMTKKPLKSWFKENDKVRMIIALLFSQLAGIFIVAKHYHGNHYLLPILTLNGLILIFIIMFITDNLNLIKRVSLISALVLLILIGGSAFNIPMLKYADYGYRISNEETAMIETRLKTEFKDNIKVYYRDRVNKYAALEWGNDYARSKFSNILTEIYPDGLFYSFANNTFHNWQADIPLADFIKKYGKKLLLLDVPSSHEEIIKLRNKSLFLNKLYIGRLHNIYEIDTTDSRLFINTEYNTKWQLFFDPDSVSNDGSFFVNGVNKIHNNSHRNNEKSYSGSNSVKLSDKNNFAFDYTLDSLQAGQQYQVTVWASGKIDNLLLVTASIAPDELWLSSNNVVAASEDWKKIKLHFTVPENLSKGLKVYAWNNSGSSVYLDDFTITRLK